MRNRGFSKFELIAVIAIVMTAAAIGVPEILANQKAEAAKQCAFKLDRVNFAKEQWALEHRQPSGTAVTQDELVPGYISLMHIDEAKAMPGFEIGKVGEKSSCKCGSN
ncbi:MAG: hypothetical protein JNJ45_01955 [Chthonomonas sp.]|nr:hypothetical protein [Chthonomonas sp.]